MREPGGKQDKWATSLVSVETGRLIKEVDGAKEREEVSVEPVGIGIPWVIMS